MQNPRAGNRAINDGILYVSNSGDYTGLKLRQVMRCGEIFRVVYSMSLIFPAIDRAGSLWSACWHLSIWPCLLLARAGMPHYHAVHACVHLHHRHTRPWLRRRLTGKRLKGEKNTIFFSVSWVSVRWLSWIIWLLRKGIYHVRLVRRPWKIYVPVSSFATQLLGLVNKVWFEHALVLNCQHAIMEDLINSRKVTVQGLLNYSWDGDMQLVFSYSNCIYCLETHSFIDWSPLSHVSLHVVVATNPP